MHNLRKSSSLILAELEEGCKSFYSLELLEFIMSTFTSTYNCCGPAVFLKIGKSNIITLIYDTYDTSLSEILNFM